MITFLGNNNQHLYEDLIVKYRKERDIVVSCQYPYLVPESIIKNNLCVNIHYGILPFYRGMNPIYWQIMNGQTAGTTLHYMDSQFDTGDIISKKCFPIGNMVAHEVFDQCEKYGVQLLEEFIDSILDGTAPRIKQSSLGDGHYFKRDDIDWNRDTRIGLDDIVLDDSKLRASCFRGKQYPRMKINGRYYELRPV